MWPDIVAWLHAHGAGGLVAVLRGPGFPHALAFVALIGLVIHRGRRAGYEVESLLWLALAGGLGGVVMTRVWYLVEREDLRRLPLRDWLDGSRGTASWGAYVGVALGLVLAARALQLGVPRVFDLVASCAGVGHLFGRWACVLQGDDFGRVTSASWGITYPKGSLAWEAQVRAGELTEAAARSLPVHPVAPMLAAASLVDLLVASAVWRRWPDRPGVTLAAYLGCHGLTRFPVEFLRDPRAGGAATGLSHSQWACVACVAMAAVLLWVDARRQGWRATGVRTA